MQRSCLSPSERGAVLGGPGAALWAVPGLLPSWQKRFAASPTDGSGAGICSSLWQGSCCGFGGCFPPKAAVFPPYQHRANAAFTIKERTDRKSGVWCLEGFGCGALGRRRMRHSPQTAGLSSRKSHRQLQILCHSLTLATSGGPGGAEPAITSKQDLSQPGSASTFLLQTEEPNAQPPSLVQEGRFSAPVRIS